MNKKVALCLALLKGDVINVSNSIRLTGYSNPAREIPREVEIPFSVKVSRTKMDSKDQFGNYVTWCNYRLNFTGYNEKGISAMREYVKKEMQSEPPPKTDAENKQRKQAMMLFDGL